jgi:DNA-binding response OmpR family regulator
MRILVVEDEQKVANALREGLEGERYDVVVERTGENAFFRLTTEAFDLILLDLGLPGRDGLEILATLRAKGVKTPVLILTARDTLQDRVAGLDSGADDYLVKPFERQELLARIRALLRRRPPRGTAALTVGDLRLNPDTREIRRGDREIDLTNREFELLEYLMRNERLVISRERLLEEVWGYDPAALTNTIDVFISNLRRKLESGGEPRLLHTKRGAGYVVKT